MWVQIESTIKGRAENKNHNSTYIFYGIMPVCQFQNGNLVRTITPKPFKIFSQTWFKYKALSDDMQRTRTITPFTFLYGIMSLGKYHYGNHVGSVTLKPFEIFSHHFSLTNSYRREATCFKRFIKLVILDNI